ncbi:HIT-like protein [Dendrothele bispora CBS 962.96]|uniref:HIT-like protein n=1 Tax=Dendrothele bispora (strain CBS 962.96) TaxID=1314807 RepID=A0A4S8LCI0_DENBC|nr:HIT-like protein [Dendrothele bispora CBS 962.96]
MADALLILQKYAQRLPSSLPQSILFSHSSETLTIYDAYPKAKFHFLILPRVKPQSELSLKDLDSLKSLLAGDKTRAKQVIEALNEDAMILRKEIEDEMMKLYGFKWSIYIGFHGAPSMHHLHLHVLSSDLCSSKLKNKKHFNSFHPKLGFFLHIDDVLSWFEADPAYFTRMAALEVREYEALLKKDLFCWKCDSVMKNMPILKAHLQKEWDEEAAQAKARAERKRRFQERYRKTDVQHSEAEPSDAHIDKKQRTSTENEDVR